MAERIIMAARARQGIGERPGVYALCSTDGGYHPFVVRWYGTTEDGDDGAVHSGSGDYYTDLGEAFRRWVDVAVREAGVPRKVREMFPLGLGARPHKGIVRLYDARAARGDGEQVNIEIRTEVRA